MRILITGANGFIGTHLTHYFQSRGDTVVALCRSGKLDNNLAEVYQWELGEKIPASAVENIHCVIHLAHDFEGDKGAQKTLQASCENICILSDMGIPRQLFFSSYSAGEHASSLYGATKYAIERAIKDLPGVVIVRPGLVLGDSGIYGRITRMAKKLPIIGLPDGGHGVVPVIDIHRLCEETYKLSKSNTSSEANIFEPQLKSLRSLVIAAASQANKNPIIINIPSVLILALLKLLGFLPIKLPVNADNLRGFLANQHAQHQSTIADKT